MDFPNIKQTYTGNMNLSCVVLSPAVATGGNLGRRGRKELGKVVYDISWTPSHHLFNNLKVFIMAKYFLPKTGLNQ